MVWISCLFDHVTSRMVNRTNFVECGHVMYLLLTNLYVSSKSNRCLLLDRGSNDVLSLALTISHIFFLSDYYFLNSWLANRVVCLSVRPSVCLSVTLCIVAFRVGVGGWKLYHLVPTTALPIHFLRHFCCRMYCLARKHNEYQREAKKLAGNTAIG